MMFSCRAALLVAVGLALLPGRVQASTISFTDFSSGAGLTLNGSQNGIPTLTIPTLTANVLRLTNGGGNQAGSAWFNTPQDVGLGFDTTFQFQISQGGADGFTFAIQNGPANPLNALGAAGDGIGYGGILNALVFEFDTFCNSPLADCLNGFNGINDPNGNHISVITGGPGGQAIQLQSNAIGYPLFLNGLSTASPINLLDDGQAHTSRIVYDASAQTLKLYLDSNLMISLTGFNLASTINLSGGQAYMGFTSGTGALSANHDILNWSSVTGSPTSAVPEPGSLLLLGTGVLLVAVRLARKA